MANVQNGELTITDILIVIILLAVAMLALLSIHQIDKQKPRPARWFGEFTHIAEYAAFGVIAGLALSGPVLLVSQFLRGRQAGVVLGEYLWLATLLSYSIVYCVNPLVENVIRIAPMILFGFWVMTQIILSIVSVVALTKRGMPPMHYIGCSITACAGTFIVVDLFLHPIDL